MGPDHSTNIIMVSLYQLEQEVLSKTLRDHVRLIYLQRRIINLLPFFCFYHCYNHYGLLFLLIVHSFYDNIEHDIILLKKHIGYVYSYIFLIYNHIIVLN